MQRALADDPVLVTNVNFGPITDFQRDILSDGFITLAEYKSAEEAYRTCEIANGFSVAPLELTGIGRYTSPATNMPGDMLSNRGIQTSCTAQYTGLIESAWDEATAPIATKVAQVQQPAMAKCLAAAGFTDGYAAVEAAIGTDPAADQAGLACFDAVTRPLDVFVYLG